MMVITNTTEGLSAQLIQVFDRAETGVEQGVGAHLVGKGGKVFSC